MTHYHHTHITTPTLLTPYTCSRIHTFGHENNLSLTAPASGVQTFSVKSKEGGKKGATKDATIGVTRDGLMLLDPITGP